MHPPSWNFDIVLLIFTYFLIAACRASSLLHETVNSSEFGPSHVPPLPFDPDRTSTSNHRYDTDESSERYGLSEENYQQMRQGVNALRKAHAHRHNRTVTDDELSSAPLPLGDILLTPAQLQHMLDRAGVDGHSRKKRNMLNYDNFPMDKWTSFPIKYVIDPSISARHAFVIDTATAEWMRQTCLTFEKHNATENITEQYIYFTNTSSGCFSSLGKVDLSIMHPQYINLEYPGCLYFSGVPIHEIGHSIGLFHEQSRPDRDSFVTVFPNNIIAGDLSQYYEESYFYAQTYNISYDYGSIMHYGPLDFSIDDVSYAMLPFDMTQLNTLGQRAELSFYDSQIVNRAYCDNVCPTKLACQRGGYTDPKNCTVCRCPDGWSGTFCQQLEPNSNGCTPTLGMLSANTTIETLTSPFYFPNHGPFVPGSTCTWQIQAPSNYVINFWFDWMGLTYTYPRSCSHWVEVQYKTTHITRGQRFCGYYHPPYNETFPLTSDGSQILVLFRAPAFASIMNMGSAFYQGFEMYYQLGTRVTEVTSSLPTSVQTLADVSSDSPGVTAGGGNPSGGGGSGGGVYPSGGGGSGGGVYPSGGGGSSQTAGSGSSTPTDKSAWSSQNLEWLVPVIVVCTVIPLAVIIAVIIALILWYYDRKNNKLHPEDKNNWPFDKKKSSDQAKVVTVKPAPTVATIS